MKVQIDKILSNPYRRIEKYPLNVEKIEALKQSIEETGLWKNAFCVRQHQNKKGYYELVFGHHTLQAARELGFKEVNVSIEELSNEVMIKRMANENMELWGPTTITILETVGAIKEYIEEIVKKCISLEEIAPYKFIGCLFENEFDFQNTKSKGIGIGTILKFLGSPWKNWQIQDALEILNNEKIKIEAVEKIPKLNQAKEITRTFSDYEVDKDDQEDIVEEVKNEIEENRKEGKINKAKRKEIAEKIIENKGYEKKEGREYHKTKELKNKVIINFLDSMQIANGSLVQIMKEWEYCEEEERQKLLRQIELMMDTLKEYKELVNWNLIIKG